MFEKLKLIINEKESRITKNSDDHLDEMGRNWHNFLRSDSYLTFRDHEKFSQKKIFSEKVPWYFFWNSRLKDKIKENKLKTIDIYKDIEDYNKEFIGRKLKENNNFFEGKEDNLKHPLDDEQRLAIIKDDMYSLVVASAGSGKTSVLTSKIAYLIKKQKIDKSKILAIAFTNNAKTEMQERLKKNYGLNVQINTFHSLGKSIIKENIGENPQLFWTKPNEFKEIIRSIFSNNLKKENFRKLFLDYLSDHFIEEVDDSSFEEKERYYGYMRSRRYTTLDNREVKSISEKQIANFLFKNKIEYKYEDEPNWSDNGIGYKKYKPDFYLPEYDVYIENWAIDEQAEVPEWFEWTTERYLGKKHWAEKQFEKHGKILVETYDHQRKSGILIEELVGQLKKYNVQFRPMNYTELVNNTYLYRVHEDGFLNLFCNFIRVAKSNSFTPKDVRDKIKINAKFTREKFFGDIISQIYTDYEEQKNKSNLFDYSDYINLAVEVIKEKGKYLDRYDYILVDEFQDISIQRMGLIKGFVNSKSNTKLFCVGDDWQSIYKFSGSEVKYFIEFYKYFEKPDLTYLKTNYRCSKRIVDISNKIILKNKHRFEKEVISKSKIKGNIKLETIDKFGYSDKEKERVVERICELVEKKKVSPEDILVLSRFNMQLRKIKPELNSFGIPIAEKRGNKKGVRFETAHSSKGLEADYVFLLGANSGTYGFPCEIEDNSLLNLVKIPYEEGPFDEERRLFYVALTRAKKEINIFSIKNSESIFVKELEELLLKSKKNEHLEKITSSNGKREEYLGRVVNSSKRKYSRKKRSYKKRTSYKKKSSKHKRR